MLNKPNRPTKSVKAKSTARAKPAKIVDTSAAPSHLEIALRAYELYIERGLVHGADVDDWLRAERELQNRGRY